MRATKNEAKREVVLACDIWANALLLIKGQSFVENASYTATRMFLQRDSGALSHVLNAPNATLSRQDPVNVVECLHNYPAVLRWMDVAGFAALP